LKEVEERQVGNTLSLSRGHKRWALFGVTTNEGLVVVTEENGGGLQEGKKVGWI